jgi:hypothetical protein
MLIGAVAGSGMGFACGMIPLNAAKEVHREGAGLASLVACVIVGAALGCLGALPLALFLASIIRGMGEAVDHTRSPWARRRGAGVDRHGQRVPRARYTAYGRTIVCNRCRQTSDRLPDGSIPPECPDCRLVFEDIPTVRSARRNRPAEVIDLEAADPDRRPSTY